MKGVKKAGEYLSYYRITQKTVKWIRKVILYMINCGLFNMFQIYCRSSMLIRKQLMIRNVLTRRREYGTYLATARRHRRRIKMQKRDE